MRALPEQLDQAYRHLAKWAKIVQELEAARRAATKRRKRKPAKEVTR